MVYLDDRPVIEQLTEPSPANVIHDVHARFQTFVLDAGYDEKTESLMIGLLDEVTDAMFEALA